MQSDGKRVALLAVHTKGREDLERVASGIPRVTPEQAQRDKPDVVIIDDVERDEGWKTALGLRDGGVGVVAAFDISHLESVAPSAEALLGHPIVNIVPLSFLQSADEVVAIDVSPRLLQNRPKDEKLGEQELYRLRNLLLRTIDNLMLPAMQPGRMSIAAAYITKDIDPVPYLRRTAAVAQALDLALEVVTGDDGGRQTLAGIARDLDAHMLQETVEASPAGLDSLHAALVAMPHGKLASKLSNMPLPYDLLIVGAEQTYIGENQARSPHTQTAGDRMRVGYGKLTVYLGAAAGAGKTFAALDRAHQLAEEGRDVVVAAVNTRGHTDTDAQLSGLAEIPRKRMVVNGTESFELDRDALIARRPQVAVIDELAHTNTIGSSAPKRFYDILAALRAGIDVITTLNIAQLEGLSDTVLRLTGTVVKETLPDGVLALADELILVDVTPETLQRRLSEGKIYPPERVEAARSTFFRPENLLALRELALREAMRTRNRGRIPSPFERILLSVGSRDVDVPMIARAGRIAARLAVEFAIAHVTTPNERVDPQVLESLRAEARKTNTEWIAETAEDVPAKLLEIARSRPETTIALAGTKRAPRWLQQPSFARRLLDAGARELLILAPRAAIAARPLPEEIA